jgi:hypothetical protein
MPLLLTVMIVMLWLSTFLVLALIAAGRYLLMYLILYRGKGNLVGCAVAPGEDLGGGV